MDIEKIISLAIVALVIAIGYIFVENNKEEKQLIAECIQLGENNRFECMEMAKTIVWGEL